MSLEKFLALLKLSESAVNFLLKLSLLSGWGRRRICSDARSGVTLSVALQLWMTLSRSCPGSTVSLAYGVRRNKFLLCDSKRNLIKLFISENPQCKFKPSVLRCSGPGLGSSKLLAVETESGTPAQCTPILGGSSRHCTLLVLAATLSSLVELPKHLPCVILRM